MIRDRISKYLKIGYSFSEFFVENGIAYKRFQHYKTKDEIVRPVKPIIDRFIAYSACCGEKHWSDLDYVEGLEKVLKEVRQQRLSPN